MPPLRQGLLLNNMALLKIYGFGHPILRKKARALSKEELGSDAISSLISDMRDTMEKEEGVGIAAPQVGESIQLALVELIDMHPRDSGDEPELLVLINPVITESSAETEDDWEGCLSLPEVRGVVPRPQKITVSYLDQDGGERKKTLTGLSARVVQHEVDHLNGILFVDRMRDMSTLSTREEMERQFHQEKDY
jgi:peptide deformylase